MAIIRRKRGHTVPGLNTASLPDLIFTVLFFFMLVTHMRTVTLKVKYKEPQGTELTNLVNKSTTLYIYIGHPTDESESSDKFVIQLNDKCVTPSEIEAFIESERDRMQIEDKERMTAVIKADRKVPMWLISDIKDRLRKMHVLNIYYSGVEKVNKTETLSH